MHFELDIGGQRRRLQIERRDSGYEVVVDGRTFLVDPKHIGREALSLLVRESDGVVRSVNATVSARSGSPDLEVAIDGHVLPASLVSRFGRRAGDTGSAGAGPQTVVAPMPGKVVRVMVAPGDAVEPRQGLVVIEAMKMENELRAGRAGRVKAVRVAPGQSVEAGALLVTVE